MMNFDKAFEWWLKQGTNKKLSVVRTAKVEFGDKEFADVFWEYGDSCGRDRIFPKGKGYKVVEL